MNQKNLDKAVEALIEVANTVTTQDVRKLRIVHPLQKASKREWEAIVCGVMASHFPFADGVLPEDTYVIDSCGFGERK